MRKLLGTRRVVCLVYEDGVLVRRIPQVKQVFKDMKTGQQQVRGGNFDFCNLSVDNTYISKFNLKPAGATA